MTASDRAAQTYAERASAAYRALLAHFPVTGTDPGLLAERNPPEQPGRPQIAFLWPFSQALEADLAMSRLASGGGRPGQELTRRLAGLGRYWRPEPEPPGFQSTVMRPLGSRSDVFYDDNLWAALALIEHGRLTGSDEHSSRVRAIFRLIESGWDGDGRHPAPGGVFWVRADWSRDRNTVSTAPASKLASHLYELTGEEDYLDWSLRLYAWVERELRAPNGLYWDHVDLAGRIEKTQWSYNQGSMIGANALLYHATGRPAHLEQAREIAATALALYDEAGLLGQPVAFNAIFFRDLLLLQSLDQTLDYRPGLRAYVDALWAQRVETQTGLYHERPGQPTALLDQAATVQLAALAVWDPADYRLLA